jgi:ubiquinone/menaquinone biosynthesis C-methylase UbiE
LATAGAVGIYVPLGVHLVGSIPLGSADEVFRTVGAALGDRLRRIPDGETGARADWIVWQYPVLSSRPEFEVAPPAPDFYRALPRLKVRDGASAEDIQLGSLGYAGAAESSFRTFRQLKRDGVIPAGCRFQVSLPTPLGPVSAFIAPENQAELEPVYEAAMLAEIAQLLELVPHDQLAIQWDTNFEFGMLEGELTAWFAHVDAGVLARLLRLGRAVPAGVELGFHFCYGDGRDPRRAPQASMRRVVDAANALGAGLGRSLDWLHLPAAGNTADRAFFEPLAGLRLPAETELYLGLLRSDDQEKRTLERIALAHELVGELGLATPCGWGRLGPAKVPGLLAAHARHSRPVSTGGERARFAWPEGVLRIPDQEWVGRPVDSFGLQYDTVENHGWYRNLDPTVEELARILGDGDVLIDYSGGTGILLDRLLLRIFDRQVGLMIVDSSPKFLRVALERFRDDDRVAFRRLHFLRDEQRLELLEEVVEPAVRADAIVSTNAIHLYYDLEDTLRSWARVLKPGGRVLVNSGNLRNPAARPNEWIIDETVYVIGEIAAGIVRTDPRWERYRDVLDDPKRLGAYTEFRDRVFLAPRPLDDYVGALRGAGFEIEQVSARTIEADVSEWYEFLAAYHDAVLGWVGGTEKVDGIAPSPGAVDDRLELMRRTLEVIFGGRSTFLASWTYIECRL